MTARDRESGTSQPGATRAFERVVATGRLRWRWGRMLRTAAWVVTVYACVAYAYGLVILFADEGLVTCVPWLMLCVLGLLFGGSAGAFLWPVDRRRLLMRLDALAGLADDALAAGELTAGARPIEDFWIRRVLSRSLIELGRISWSRVWPLGWPRHMFPSVMSAVFLTILLLLLLGHSEGRIEARERPELRILQGREIQEMFDRWTEPVEPVASDGWQQVEQAVADFARELERSEVSEQEMFLSLNRVEDRLREVKEKVDSRSLEPFADEMAEALDRIEGMGRAAAAVRRREFTQAAEAMEEAEGKPSGKDPKNGELRTGGIGERDAQDLEELARKIRDAGHEDLARTMESLAQATRSNDSSGMKVGLREMGAALEREGLRSGASQSMGAKIAQVKQVRSQLGGRNGMHSASRQMSGFRQGGREAGSGEHRDPFGKPSEIVARREEIHLRGQWGEGDSNVETVNSSTGGRSEAMGAAEADFQEYEKMSRRAIADEMIPPSFRDSIRRYFESIRPSTERLEDSGR